MLVAGITIPGDKASKKKKEVVKINSKRQKTVIIESPSSDTDSQNGMEGIYKHSNYCAVVSCIH